MLRRLFVLLFLLLVVELAILVWIASKMGPLFTIALVLFMGFAGAALARYEGLRVWRQFQERIERGEAPADSLLDALLVLVAGMLLVFPGVLTDVVGLALLIPPLRRLVRFYIREQIRARVHIVPPYSQWRRAGEPGSDHDRIIDVRVIDVESRKPAEEAEQERRSQEHGE